MCSLDRGYSGYERLNKVLKVLKEMLIVVPLTAADRFEMMYP